jgi:hypothetical protein
MTTSLVGSVVFNLGMRPADTPTKVRTTVQLEREALYSEMVSAFSRKDYGAFRDAVSPGVSLRFAGSSPLAGTQLGLEQFVDHLAHAGDVIRSADRQIIFEHHEDEMVARFRVTVTGPREVIETTLWITVVFDDSVRATSISVQPDDQVAFDRVLTAALDRT